MYAAFFVARNAELWPVCSAARLIVVPTRAEHKPIMLDKPEVLVLDLFGSRVQVLVRHLAARLRIDRLAVSVSRDYPAATVLAWCG